MESFTSTLEYFPENPGSSITYLITDENPIIVDLGSTQASSAIIERLKILGHDFQKKVFIFLTHYHSDHIAGFRYLTKYLNLHCYVQTKRLPIPAKSTTLITDQQVIKLGKSVFRVLFTPGHTRESICLYEKTNKILFSGDTIFLNGEIGWTMYPGGNSAIHESIKKLLPLDVEILAPGHVHPVMNGSVHVKKAHKNPWKS